MDDKPKTRYVDADKLMEGLYSAIPGSGYGYSNDPIGIAINQQINQAMLNAFSGFISGLQAAITRAATPYENDKCMLCKQRDWDIKPDCQT